MDATDTNDNSLFVLELLRDLKAPEFSIHDKYRKQNEIRKYAKANPKVLELMHTILEGDQQEYIYKKLLLICELEAHNIQYLVQLVLKSKEPALIKYGISKYYWVFKEDSPFSDPTFFVKDFLPVVSYTTRHAILWQLAKNVKNQTKCEALYNSLDALVGPSTANIILPACSTSFVENIIKTKESLKLSCRQLSWLMKKHPQSSIMYLKKIGILKYPQMMNRVILFDPIAFADLYEKNKSLSHRFRTYFNIYPRRTHQLLKGCLKRVLDQATVYSQLLHKPTLFKSVGKDNYMKVLISEFPDSLEAFEGYEYAIVRIYEEWIDFLPSKVDKGELFKTAFELRYGVPLIDCVDCISKSSLKIFSEEDRDTFADLKLAAITPENCEDNNFSTLQGSWISCKSVNKSIPQLKYLISQESDHYNRQQLLTYLVQTCSINRDGIALNQVCKYYADRHRNERQETHARFIADIATEFDIKDMELDENALHYFVEILKIYTMGLEKDSFVQISESLLEAIYFSQADNCLSTSWILPIVFKKKLDEVLRRRPFWTFDREKHLTETYLTLMERMVERMDTLQIETLDEWCRFINAILKWCQDWNKHNTRRGKQKNTKLPMLSIKHFPNIEEKLPELFEDTTEISKSLFHELIQTLLRDPELKRDPCNPVYLKCLEEIPDESITLYFMKHNAFFFNQNWGQVRHCIFDVSTNVTKIITKMKQNGYNWHLDSLKLEFSENILNNSLEGTKKIHMVKIASLAFTTNVFMECVKNYYPEPREESMSAHFAPDLYLGLMALRRGIAASLKNLDHPALGFPALVHFCAGDYLKYALGSLYSVVLNSELQESIKFLNNLSQRPAVSVKKHGLRLMSQVTVKDGFARMLATSWENDAHPTIRVVILRELLSRIHYDDTAWEVLKTGIESLSATKDKVSLAELLRCENIPNSLFQNYLDLIWRKYKEEKIGKAYHAEFARFVCNNVNQLSSIWLQKFLKENLFMTSSNHVIAFQYEVIQILITLLLFPSSSPSKVFLTIVDENFKEVASPSMKLTPVWESGSPYKLFDRFIRNLCQSSFTPDTCDLKKGELIGLFEEIQNLSLFDHLSPNTFSMKLFLKFGVAIHSFQNGDDDDKKSAIGKGKLLGQVLDDYILEHGKGISTYFSKLLLVFIQGVWTSIVPDVQLDLASGFLESSPFNLDEKKIILLKLLPDTVPKMEETKKEYFALLKQISESESFLVQLHFSEWSLTSSVQH